MTGTDNKGGLNLLLINYVMDPASQVLSWQVKVAFALAKHFNHVIVLTHKSKTISNVPKNVTIIEFPFLAKSPFRWFGTEYILNFWIVYLHTRYKFDRCFIHMNYRWTYRFAPFFYLSKIPVSIWYAHGGVSKYLRLAHIFAGKIITSTPGGFRIKSEKVVYIGQGIDTHLFQIYNPYNQSSNILYVGRISKVKRLEAAIDILSILVNDKNMPWFTLTIIGAPLNEPDKRYYTHLQQYIFEKRVTNNIFFKGAIKHNEVPQYYADCFLHISFSNTGSIDKSLMESLASGCPVLTSNSAFFELIEEKYKIRNDNYQTTANQLISIYQEQLNINRQLLRQIVIDHHDFDSFVNKLCVQITNI